MELECVFLGLLFLLAELNYGGNLSAASLCLHFASVDFSRLLSTSEKQIACSVEYASSEICDRASSFG
jgi:hypothetical protein